jgi:hypothetical protein
MILIELLVVFVGLWALPWWWKRCGVGSCGERVGILPQKKGTPIVSRDVVSDTHTMTSFW